MNARVIPTGVHGVLDYLASGVNLAFPRLLGLQDAPWAALVPRLDGAAGLVYSLITNYELGALKAVPMPAHLALDAAKGLFMALSPWLFGFARNGIRYWLPHVLMGTADVVVALTTKTR
ncbi:MAG: SPW repeat protein [Actinomycetota bacterium]|nr:SPW repeat protein [Actinomycetota bacterium]